MAPPDYFCQAVRPAEGYYSSQVQASECWPIRTFLPTGYEPNYPYPLLVFFHGHGGSEEQVLRLAPRLSRRNYICISLRGPEPLAPRPGDSLGYSWGHEDLLDSPLEEYVMRAVEQTRRSYHVHTERIYLAGVCEGATLAYRLGLLFPQRFAGVIALNGAMPRGGPLLRFHEVRSLKVFIGHGLANLHTPLGLAQRDCRLLYTAGLSVRLHTYPTTDRIHPHMLRDVNRWVMEHINAAEGG